MTLLDKIRRNDGFYFFRTSPISIYQALTVLVVLVFILLTAPKMGAAAIKSDASLAIYASQRIADGEAPYAGYIIMHPPLPHLTGGLALFLGRLVGFEDLIVIRVMCLVLSLGVLLVLSKMGAKFRYGLGPLAAGAASWNSLMLMTVWGMHVKLLMLLFYTLMLWMLVDKNWLRAGLFAGLAVFSWSGGVVFIPIAVIVWWFSKDERGKSGWKLLTGFMMVVLLTCLGLALIGSLQDFINQYARSLGHYSLNKLTDQGVYDPQTGLMNIFRGGAISIPDLLVIALGLGGIPIYVAHKRSVLGGDIPSITLLTAVSVAGVLVLVDYQSPFDLLPLLPPLAIFAAWLVDLGIRGWVKFWVTDKSLIYALLVLTMLSAVRKSAFQDIPDRLAAQREAAEWISDPARGYPIQAFGDLSILVLSGKRNALPVIHAGPKTYLAMENSGWTVERLVDEIEELQPGIISLDVRNVRKAYLTPLMVYLGREYEWVGNTAEPYLYIYASAHQPEAVMDAAVFIQIHQGKPWLHNVIRAAPVDVSDIYVNPDELYGLDLIPISHLDGQHRILSYTTNGEMNLYWWSPADTSYLGLVGTRWLDGTGEPAGEWQVEPVCWLPGYASKSTHQLPESPDHSQGLEVCILGRKGVDELVCQGNSLILVYSD